ncbi:Uncharacterised protein [uncultured archaeon]|nr:Uncharacterised protein [uncultured archaeon]
MKDPKDTKKGLKPEYPQNLGWKCPVCGRGNSPFTTTCPCVQAVPKWPTQPSWPDTPWVPYQPPYTPWYPGPYYQGPTCQSRGAV